LRNYVIRRILLAFPLFFGISIIVFTLMMASPMDYVDILRAGNPTMTEAEVNNLRHTLGLDRPDWEQYIFWLIGRNTEIGDLNNYIAEFGDFLINSPGRFVQSLGVDLGISGSDFTPGFIFGNMGRSYTGSSINDLIGAKAWETMKLQIAALIMALMIGIPLGIFSARKPYSKLDNVGTTLALFGVSMPVFWTGVMAIMLITDWKIFPFNVLYDQFGFRIPAIGSRSYLFTGEETELEIIVDELMHMILPTMVLGLAGTALILRLTRSSMLEVLRQDYILTARSKGLVERIVIYKHALRNAMLPVVTIVGLSFGFLLAGAALTETVFAWPGLGREAVFRIVMRDYNFMMGINMLISIMVIFANLVTDITYAFLDPRIRY
ncbi:MAG: ABC transporter permease, partial [Candidatus Hodarchaeota archaeon]